MPNPHPTDGTANLKDFQEGEDKRRTLKGRKPRYEIAKIIEERGARLKDDDPEGRTIAEAAVDAMWEKAQVGDGTAVKAFAELAKYGWGTPEVKDVRQVLLMIVAGAQQRGLNPSDDPVLGAIFAAADYRVPKLASPRPNERDSSSEIQATRSGETDIVDAEAVS